MVINLRKMVDSIEENFQSTDKTINKSIKVTNIYVAEAKITFNIGQISLGAESLQLPSKER